MVAPSRSAFEFDLAASHRDVPEMSTESIAVSCANAASCRSRMDQVAAVLRQAKVRKATSLRIMAKLRPLLVPAGLKAKVRGDTFNAVVARQLTGIRDELAALHPALAFDLRFEQPHANANLHEIPDWTMRVSRRAEAARDAVATRSQRRRAAQVQKEVPEHTFVGYNQLDMWSGGHQLNRGSKYILDPCIHRRMQRARITLLCVVYSKPTAAKPANATKAARIVASGIANHRLCNVGTLARTLKFHIKRL
jgi:hypothetical protein